MISQRLQLLKTSKATGGQLPAALGPQDVHPTTYASAVVSLPDLHHRPLMCVHLLISDTHNPQDQHNPVQSLLNDRLICTHTIHLIVLLILRVGGIVGIMIITGQSGNKITIGSIHMVHIHHLTYPHRPLHIVDIVWDLHLRACVNIGITNRLVAPQTLK